MTLASDVYERYAHDLRNFGASLADDFAAATNEVEPYLTAEELDAWALGGVRLANHSLRSWEAAVEYFRASPATVERLGGDGAARWLDVALRLAEQIQFCRDRPFTVTLRWRDDNTFEVVTMEQGR